MLLTLEQSRSTTHQPPAPMEKSLTSQHSSSISEIKESPMNTSPSSSDKAQQKVSDSPILGRIENLTLSSTTNTLVSARKPMLTINFEESLLEERRRKSNGLDFLWSFSRSLMRRRCLNALGRKRDSGVIREGDLDIWDLREVRIGGWLPQLRRFGKRRRSFSVIRSLKYVRYFFFPYDEILSFYVLMKTC